MSNETWTGCFLPAKVIASNMDWFGYGWVLYAPTAIEGAPLSWKFPPEITVMYV